MTRWRWMPLVLAPLCACGGAGESGEDSEAAPAAELAPVDSIDRRPVNGGWVDGAAGLPTRPSAPETDKLPVRDKGTSTTSPPKGGSSPRP